jgi:arylamine N-acetyltransferase
MSDQCSSADIFTRYLDILGVTPQKPCLDALSEIVGAHLMRVPFENVSKLYYKKHLNQRRLPDVKQYLDGIEKYNFGGTCYTNNYYFYLLLDHLGYNIKLCGADMNHPDVHMVNMVEIDKRQYLVDVGYAAPFLTPMPRDLAEDHEIVLGRDRYILKPQDEEGHSRLEMHRDGALRHGYTAKPIPRTIEHFAGCIAHSYTDEATFMNALLLVRFSPNFSLRINNLEVIESEGSQSKRRQLENHDEVIGAVVEYFSIPEAIVARAITGLDLTGDAWS